jgi:hypothetical protein
MVAEKMRSGTRHPIDAIKNKNRHRKTFSVSNPFARSCIAEIILNETREKNKKKILDIIILI